jgi:3-deoxy-D-manno-octulosonic-acid transferase
MQTDTDAERIRNLGVRPERVFVSGNMKFDAGLTPVPESITAELRQRFNPNGSPLILAASTHAPEERIVLEAFKRIKADSNAKPRLFIVPRHPERFAEVAALIGTTGLGWTRRSASPSVEDTKSEVVLLDTIGELQAAYALSSVVFVGGSIPKFGGHNILEPAAAALSIVTGRHTENFKQIVEQFARAGAIIQLSATSEEEAAIELSTIFSQLLGDMALRKELGRKAKALLQQNVGATRHTLQLITPLIESHSFAHQQKSSLAGQEAHSS